MRALAVVDGRTDLVVVEGTTHHVYRSTGTGYAPVASHAAHASSTAAGIWADVNGDGLADYVTFDDASAYIPHISTGITR